VNPGFNPKVNTELPGGWIFAQDDSHPANIVVFSKDGKKVLEENKGLSYSTILGEDQKIYFIGSLLSSRAKIKPRLLYTEKSSDPLEKLQMVPAVLNDGRIVAFCKDSIHLLDAGGRELRTFATSTELLEDLGPGARAVNCPYMRGIATMEKSNDMPFHTDMLTTAINAKALKNPSVYRKIPLEKSLGGCTFPQSAVLI